MKMRTLFLATAILMSPTLSLAADYYVSTSGNDSSSGTPLAPFKTISHAASVVSAGGVVHVAAGTYYGNVASSKSGTASARIRFVSDTKWGTKIIGTGTEAMWVNNGSYVDIIGFDVSGPGRVGIQNGGSYTLISNNHVHNLTISGGCNGSGGAGIVNSNYSGSNGDIISNVVHDIGTPGACNGVQGIYHSNYGGRIIDNLVYRVSAFGIHLWHAANQVTVMNNTIFNNGSASIGGGIVAGRGDSGAGVMVNTIISNNIVVNNLHSGISQYCYSGDPCIGSGNVTANNLVSGNGGGNISLKVGSATGTIAADPQFVNYQANGSGDYHLKSTSPAINHGVPLSGVATDLDGKPRVSGSAVDIGAYEFNSSVSPTPTPTPSPTPSSAVTVSATSLTFPSQTIGTMSAIQFVTIKNTSTKAFTIPAAFIMTGDFAFGGKGTCALKVSYAPGASCTASVVFKPTAIGARTGSLSMTTSASSTPMIVKLYGTGK
jgi:hypothetical protein